MFHNSVLVKSALLDNVPIFNNKEILSNSDLKIISADDLDDAAEKIVKAVKG